MISLKTLVTANRNQFWVLGILVVAVLGATGILSLSSNSLFERFIRGVPPFLAILLSTLLGFMALSFLLSKGWFAIHKKYLFRTALPFAGLTFLFALIAIGIDIKIVYQADMNILFPESILFYPIIAFLAEILFHLVPLFVLLWIATSIFNIPYSKLLWTCILLVAILEPMYQVIFMDAYPIWAMGAIWINLFLFNITQLVVFKKYGFLSMYALRLVYYLFWHIIWGELRLQILFFG